MPFQLLLHCESDCLQKSHLILIGLRFTDPAAVVQGTVTSPLSEGVVGRIDVTTTLVGQELNNDYLFGLFMESASENTTQLIGIPSSFNVQSLVVEPPMVAVSFLNELVYPTVGLSVPLQIDMFISFDNDLKIVSYDTVLRRWDEFFDYVLPFLAPQIAVELNERYNYTTTNTTELLMYKTATDVCEKSTQYCTGSNQVYESNGACMEFMTALPFGEPWAGGFDNGWCRYIHKSEY